MEENYMKNLDNNKYSESCRVCLKVKSNLKEMLNYFYDGLTYLEIYKTTCISNQEIFDLIGNLTTKICSDCKSKLLQFYDFKKQCDSSETTLAIYLSESKKVKLEVEESVEVKCFAEDVEELPFEYLISKIETEEEQEHQSDIQQFTSDKGKEQESDSTQEISNKNKCPICSEEFAIASSVSAHMKLIHKIKYRDWLMKKKIEENPDQIRIKCNYCEKSYARKDYLKEHIKKQHPEHHVEVQTYQNKAKRNDPEYLANAVTCDICGKTVLKKCFLKHVRRYHAGRYEETVKCEFCTNSFSKRTIKHHIRQNHPKLFKIQFRTKVKSDVMNKIVLLPKTQDWDTDDKVSCYFCSKPYAKNTLFQHYELVHSDDIRKKYEKDESSLSCTDCEEKFSSRPLLVAHCKNFHLELYQFIKVKTKESTEEAKSVRKEYRLKSAKVLCQICGKYCKKEHLNTHVEIVGADAVYPCNVCGKEFKKKYSRDGHRKKHFVENYPCRHCEQIFKSYDSRRIHEDFIHTKIFRYPCTFCEQSFLTSQKRTMHTRRYHTGEKPYACTFCDMRFYNSNQLKDHLETHVQTQTYECKFCDKTYNRKKSLAQHVRLSHKAERDALKNSVNQEHGNGLVS